MLKNRSSCWWYTYLQCIDLQVSIFDGSNFGQKIAAAQNVFTLIYLLIGKKCASLFAFNFPSVVPKTFFFFVFASFHQQQLVANLIKVLKERKYFHCSKKAAFEAFLRPKREKTKAKQLSSSNNIEKMMNHTFLIRNLQTRDNVRFINYYFTGEITIRRKRN